MKRAILLLALCALPLLAAATLRGQPRKLEDADGVCKFNVEVDECDFDNVEALVEDPDCETDTFSLSDIRRDINRECRRARRRADKGEKLEDLIPEFDRQDLKNYFNGGTYWNENTGVVDNEAPIIEELYDDFAQEATMRYPNYISNFAQCDMAVMCLWIRDRQPGDDNGNCERPLGQNCVDADPADNTDVCYADASRMPEAVHVPEGRAFFPDDTEGDTHAHGFAFKRNSLSNRFKGNLLFYISMYDHLSQRGYAENLPLAPMCGCLDKMPSVSRADCTEVDVAEVYNVQYDASAEEDALTAERTEVEIEFNACDGATANDLYSELAQLYGDDLPADVRKYLVGPEDNDEPSNCPANADELEEEAGEEAANAELQRSATEDSAQSTDEASDPGSDSDADGSDDDDDSEEGSEEDDDDDDSEEGSDDDDDDEDDDEGSDGDDDDEDDDEDEDEDEDEDDEDDEDEEEEEEEDED